MSLLPRHLGTGSRRNIAGFIHRTLALAAYPARLIGSNPLPRGWAPKADADKAKGYLYPDEDQRLMGSASVPLCFRVYYGFLIREGMRAEEAGQLEWSDVDLERGAVVLDENKTDDPRAWALSPDVVRALRKWREVCPDKVRVFVGKWGCNSLPGQNGAARFREHLRRAGITRPELFETTDSRLNIRLHDTRATFITIKLANGRTETWISDRTGHRSSGQIHHYKRAARKVAELGLSDFAPLDEAIPELRGEGGSVETGGPVDAASEARAANEAASALPGQAPTACDVAGPREADLEAPESGRLGPRWATSEASAAEPRPEPIEIVDLHADRSAAPGKSWRHVHRGDGHHPSFRGGTSTGRWVPPIFSWRHVHRGDGHHPSFRGGTSTAEMGATHLFVEARPPGDGCHPSFSWRRVPREMGTTHLFLGGASPERRAPASRRGRATSPGWVDGVPPAPNEGAGTASGCLAGALRRDLASSPTRSTRAARPAPPSAPVSRAPRDALPRAARCGYARDSVEGQRRASARARTPARRAAVEPARRAAAQRPPPAARQERVHDQHR
ncbi:MULTISPECIES: tyrosine-type recombinase/integrase [Sorangium]|uniref:tyrosine-type recombinase/integrase n=1 Tax=Sorangium TaxID=39643 RepID=UPI003D9C17A2